MANCDKHPLPQAVRARREALAICGHDVSALPPEETLGIAFSGGGIRSATLSLGIAQALSRYDRLLSFDYMSTVSGGGYFGSFLRSLFVPNDARGPTGIVTVTDRSRFDFAQEVLKSEPSQREVHAPASAGRATIANPIWWLREHSRYLAPSGPTDFAFAISHMARNWLGMIYVFFVCALFLFAAKTLLVAGGWKLISWLGWCTTCGRDLVTMGGYKFSPFAVPAAILLFASLTVGVAFWMTEGMRPNGRWRFGERHRVQTGHAPAQFAFLRTCAKTLGGIGAIVALRWLVGDELTGLVLTAFNFGVAFVLTALGWALACYIVVVGRSYRDWNKVDQSGWFARNPTAELQRLLTRWLTIVNLLFFACVGLALIDTAGIALVNFDFRLSLNNFWQFLSAGLIPAAAFLISKLPENMPAKIKIPPQLISAIAIGTGVLLYCAVAAIAAGVVHRLAWDGPVYGVFEWRIFLIFFLIAAVLFVITGSSGGFINLSSLHTYYASRLTRAYMGATNTDRLKPGGTRKSQLDAADPTALGTGNQPRINRNVQRDYIDVSLYQTLPLPAPLHLINVTLNDSEGGSSLVDRARKGALMTFAPEGVFVGAKERKAPRAASWKKLTKGAETLTVGQLCAISGAAASSGMGRMTTLGGALTFTFANVRTGYWWARGGAFPKWGTTRWQHPVWRVFETYSYLWNEMTASYKRRYRRLYLSDGGHYENSGALELIRRGCRLIVVADNGCDPKQQFGDLEILIRTARIDLGRNIEVASRAEVEAFASPTEARFFLNGGERDWRDCSADPECGPAFALLLNVTRSNGLKLEEVGKIVWMKPQIIDGLSPDVAGYAAAHPSFPHESTGDQFFDEAQWESYRRFGVEMAIRLFGDPDGLARHIPATRPRDR